MNGNKRDGLGYEDGYHETPSSLSKKSWIIEKFLSLLTLKLLTHLQRKKNVGHYKYHSKISSFVISDL